ncbi:hypothetical protein [Cohnella sp. AR92]|uniref:hypothetical protein n=1 Tax=Cohnella sp. AR92 TaxID=648716 RepID=UPI000F8C48CB|nr:hypothetical protein [Cohnella sp. AR92]RUS47892.1 hypothetical protein ELR57_04955 [Cohnella sp. AR92]
MKMKKSAMVASVMAFGLLCGAVGAGAATGIQQIKAALNWNLKFQVDGSSWSPVDGNGNKLAPIVYNGSTYLPARAIVEKVGGTIGLSGNTISITTPSGSVDGYPTDLGGGSSNSGNSSGSSGSSGSSSGSSSSGTSSTNGMTAETAVALGKTLTFADSYSYEGTEYSTSNSITVTSVKSITRDQIADLGFRKPEEDADIEYKLVKIKVSTTAKIKSLDSDWNGSYYLSMLAPEIWGSKIATGTGGIIGGTSYGFDGALDNAVSAATNSKKLAPGESGSFTAEGSVILPVQTGETNYLVFRLQSDVDYDKSFKFFALK